MWLSVISWIVYSHKIRTLPKNTLLIRDSQLDYKSKMKLKNWIKTLGFWGFLFFLLKGLLWLSIPALIALFTD